MNPLVARSTVLSSILLCGPLAGACGTIDESDAFSDGQDAGGEGSEGDSGSDGSAGTSGSGGSDGDTGPGGRGACRGDGPPPMGCGDGVLADDEACDDGNTVDGDGCSDMCRCVDPGYSCNPPGVPCHPIAKCGDGVVVFPEPCDDGNNDDGDGCSARCKVERGYKCEGDPSECTPTTCGDGIREGSEGCDDGNTLPFDGCSSLCQAEPNCAGGVCTSECGDGLVIDEECDDGNGIDGDGCSADCTVEPGFECSEEDSCEKIADGCILRVPAIFRDFNASHSDFAVGCDGLQTGAVQPTLDAEGKPVASGSPVCQGTSFGSWYRDVAENATIVGDVVLFDDGDGRFVNRWGPAGEKWTAYTNAQWAANTVDECAAIGCVPCPWDPNVGCTADLVEYDGNPFFFPVDGAPEALDDQRFPAKVGPHYGYDSWPWEADIVPGAGNHNFHFTSEVTYWFRYDASASATLDFTGDDDVWVFVNGHLAVDLGGVHVPENGSVTIDATSAPGFDLTDGAVHPIKVFHAERKIDGSSFKLTLAGFRNTPSNCLAICGDGIVGLGEECDDGVNDGGYGECDEGCVLGGYCGDGIVQPEEDCDDGNYDDGDDCPSGCREIFIP